MGIYNIIKRETKIEVIKTNNTLRIEKCPPQQRIEKHEPSMRVRYSLKKSKFSVTSPSPLSLYLYKRVYLGNYINMKQIMTPTLN